MGGLYDAATLHALLLDWLSAGCGTAAGETVKSSSHVALRATRPNCVRVGATKKAPPAGLEPAIFGLEVRRLVH